jgi:thiamine biosynthesis protein ThiS
MEGLGCGLFECHTALTYSTFFCWHQPSGFVAITWQIDGLQEELFMPIHITLNGKPHAVEYRMDILSLLETLKVPPASVVVERNRKILHRNMFDRVVLKDGDELELIRFVGGG